MLIISGLSGAGKTITLNTLEDLGYYCVDNLPVSLLEAFIQQFASQHRQPIAVAIDSRNAQAVRQLPEKLYELRQIIPIQLLFLTSNTETLVRRFSETRRPHPMRLNELNNSQIITAIEQERELLGNLSGSADILIDTGNTTPYQLRSKIIELLGANAPELLITLQSFGFKNGTPVNADLLFDVRFLPNPYWNPDIRPYSGTQQPIIDYLDSYPEAQGYAQETADYLARWLPHFLDSGNRAYLTICIGCTGGQHRSVYITERIATSLRPHFPQLRVEHRDMHPYQEKPE